MTTNIIYLKAENDANGNPRRGYLVPNESGVLVFFDEGYNGIAAIPDRLRPWSYRLHIVKVSAAEWRRHVKDYGPESLPVGE